MILLFIPVDKINLVIYFSYHLPLEGSATYTYFSSVIGYFFSVKSNTVSINLLALADTSIKYLVILRKVLIKC